MTEKDPINKATSADKLALGIGAAAAFGLAAGLLIARQSGKAMQRYIIKNDNAKDYWQFDYLRDSVQQTRYFHGTEAAVKRRIKHYDCEVKELKKLDKSSAEALIMEQKTHLIEL